MAVSRLCSSSNFIFIESQLIRIVGMTAASLLTRIHFWLQKDNVGIIHDNFRFVYNTATQWSEQLGVSSRQVERAIAKLREIGLLRVEKLAKHKSIRTNHYAINYDVLETLVASKKALKMSEPSRQNVGIYITKKTDIAKDINNNFVNNKSQTKEQAVAPSRFITNSQPKIHSQQVAQVLDIKKNKTDNRTSKAQNTTVQDMIEYWNKSFMNSKSSLNRDLAKHLYSAFKLKFNSDINLWKHYCQTIETSSYLTGEGFKLTLQWALKFKTIDRIKAGELGVKAIPIPGAAQRLERDLVEDIHTLNESDKCKARRLTLLKRYGAPAYNAWLRNTILFEEKGDICYKAETGYGQSFIENHFGRLIKSRPQEMQVFEEERKAEMIKKILLKQIDKIAEPEKCLNSRKKLLELMGSKEYYEHIHGLNFFLREGEVQYTTDCLIRLNRARKIMGMRHALSTVKVSTRGVVESVSKEPGMVFQNSEFSAAYD